MILYVLSLDSVELYCTNQVLLFGTAKIDILLKFCFLFFPFSFTLPSPNALISGICIKNLLSVACTDAQWNPATLVLVRHKYHCLRQNFQKMILGLDYYYITTKYLNTYSWCQICHSVIHGSLNVVLSDWSRCLGMPKQNSLLSTKSQLLLFEELFRKRPILPTPIFRMLVIYLFSSLGLSNA